MNHNGVISLPSASSTQYTMGDIVDISSTGAAELSAGTTPIGVVLHDVDSTQTDRPVDIQLFSAGGIAFVKVNGAATIGQAVVANATGKQLGVPGGTGTTVGTAMETAASSGDVIRIIL